MATKCAVCGKTSQLATRLVKLRGKYNPTCQQRKKPNLQWFRLSPAKRVKACAKCIKTAHKK